MKRRYPLSEGTPPEAKCGRMMYPSPARTTMSLRTVAGLTPRPWSRATAIDATGVAVAT